MKKAFSFVAASVCNLILYNDQIKNRYTGTVLLKKIIKKH